MRRAFAVRRLAGGSEWRSPRALTRKGACVTLSEGDELLLLHMSTGEHIYTSLKEDAERAEREEDETKREEPSSSDAAKGLYAGAFLGISALALLLVLYLRFCTRREKQLSQGIPLEDAANEHVKKAKRLSMYRPGTITKTEIKRTELC